MLVEELVTEWVRHTVKETGVHDVLLSGGFFMNVKANQRLSQMTEVNQPLPQCVFTVPLLLFQRHHFL